MAYYLSVDNVYTTQISVNVFDDKRKDPMREMAFVDPDNVDCQARGLISREVQMLQGYPVVKDTAPKKLLWGGGKRAIPDVLVYYSVMIVCDRFRALAERFGPGQHQFIPVDIHTSKRAPPSVTHYWFNVCSRVDSIDPIHTTFLKKPGHEGTFYWSDRNIGEGPIVVIPNLRLVFSSSKIGNHHIWNDPHLLTGRTPLCSNAFGEAAINGTFIGLNVTRREEA